MIPFAEFYLFGPPCVHAIHSCIAIEILTSIFFLVPPNLLHSADISEKLPCCISRGILFNSFTVRLVLFVLKEEKFSYVS